MFDIEIMAKKSGSLKSLLEKEHIRKKVSSFIQEEVHLSEWSDIGTGFYIVKGVSHESETFGMEETFTKSNQSIDKNITNESCLKKNHRNINIKELLQNEEIRKQVAPFIEKQIIIPVWSDEPESEDNDISIVHEEIIVADSLQNPNERKDIVNDKQDSYVKEEIHISTELITDENPLLVENSQISNKLQEREENHYFNSQNVYKNTLEKNNVKTLRKSEANGHLRRKKIKNKRMLQGKIVRKSKNNMIANVFDETNVKSEKSISSESTFPTVSVNNSIKVSQNKIGGTNTILMENVLNETNMRNENPVMSELISSMDNVNNSINNIGNDITKNINDIQENYTINDKLQRLVIKKKVILPYNSSENNAYYHQKFINKRLKKKVKMRKLQNIHRFRKRFNHKCSKCGKVYIRIKMLRKHEVKCKNEEKIDYKCVMCFFKTKDIAIFKNHLGSHILGEVTEKSDSIRDNELQINNDEGSKQYLDEVHCSTCNWSKVVTKEEIDIILKTEDITEVEKNQENDVEIKLNTDKCKNCWSSLLYQCKMCGEELNSYDEFRKHVRLRLERSVKGTCCWRCGKVGHLSICALMKHEKICSKLITLCDKIPYVRLVRLPNISSIIDENDISKNAEQSQNFKKFTKYNKKMSDTDNLYKSMKQTNSNDDTNIFSNSVENNISKNIVNQKKFNEKSSIHSKLLKQDNTTEVHIDDDGSKVQKRRRILGTSKWMQRYCRKCNKIENFSDNFRENKACKNCRTKLLYKCVECDGKFNTYFTIAYHLRYFCAQIKYSKTSKLSFKDNVTRDNRRFRGAPKK